MLKDSKVEQSVIFHFMSFFRKNKTFNSFKINFFLSVKIRQNKHFNLNSSLYINSLSYITSTKCHISNELGA